MFIDIHAHAYRKPEPMIYGKQPFATPEQLIQRYDELNVEKALILPITGPEVYFPQSNEDVLEMVEKYPDRFSAFCNVHPRALRNIHTSPLYDALSYYRDKGCKGIGEVTANMPILHPMVQNLFINVEKAGLPLTFHLSAQIDGTYGLYDEPGLSHLELSLQKYPKLKFLAHSPVFWSEIARLETPADRCGYPKYPVTEEGIVPKLFRRYENLLGDLSAGSGHNALARDEDYAVKFLNEFQDRLFFGLDICAPDTPARLIDFLLKLKNEGKISETVFNKVARENTVKLLALN